MTRACVYTCITGDYDELHEIENPEKNVDYYCFTNNKKLQSKTWKIIQIENDNLDNQRLSRKIKMLGHPIISKNYDVSIWTDASIVWHQSVGEFIKTYLKDAPFSAFIHSQRKTVYDEAVACIRLRKDTKEHVIKTLDFLDNEKFPDDLGLYEMTVFIKRHNDPAVIKTMEIWFDMIKNYSCRDQLSFPYAAWKTGLKINAIDLNVWDNSWFYSTNHTREYRFDDSSIYYGNPDQNFDFGRYFIQPYHKAGDTYSFETVIHYDTNEIEINPTNLPGVRFKDIVLKPTFDKLQIFGSVKYHQEEVFCSGHNTIRFFGNFKKGQKLYFSIYMKEMNSDELVNLSETLWAKNSSLLNENASVNKTIYDLQNKNSELQTTLDSILSSKAWRSIKFIRKILHPTKK